MKSIVNEIELARADRVAKLPSLPDNYVDDGSNLQLEEHRRLYMKEQYYLDHPTTRGVKKFLSDNTTSDTLILWYGHNTSWLPNKASFAVQMACTESNANDLMQPLVDFMLSRGFYVTNARIHKMKASIGGPSALQPARHRECWRVSVSYNRNLPSDAASERVLQAQGAK